MNQHRNTPRKAESAQPWIPTDGRDVPWPMIALLLAALFAPALVVAQLPSGRAAADGQAAGRDDRYHQGQQALDEGRFDAAASKFAAVADDGGRYSAAARYWQAWAEWKGGDAGGAQRTLARLRKDHAGSTWLDDAQSLAAEIRASGRGGRGSRGDDVEDTSPDALKLYALNSLMHSDAPESVDAVVRLLERTEDTKLRERALFVLAQSGNRRAAEVLAEIARGERAPDLQHMAIRFLGMSESDANDQLLESIYQATDQAEIKKAVIEAYFLADNEHRLAKLAEGETDRSLRAAAIQKLGLVGATGTLHAMYSGGDDEVKRKILHALFLADDSEFLAQVARTERDPELRHAAIHSLGLTGAADALRELYTGADDSETRDAILGALFIAGDAEGLVSIAKASTTPSEREAAVKKLSLMDDEQSLAYLLEILEQ